MNSNLTDFLTRLATDESLAKAFEENKEQTMIDAGVLEEERKLVIGKQYDEIQKRLGANYKIASNNIVKAFKIE